MQKYILSIDTSCDDTSAAVTSGTTILSNVIASQTQLHKEYGGVFPTVAKQAHKENIQPVIAVALKRAKVSIDDICAIAVTQGPGLAPALEVGIDAARELAIQHKKPLIAVNHLEGHLLSVIARSNSKKQATRSKQISMTNDQSPMSNKYPISHPKGDHSLSENIQYPVLSLIISGGNSLFVLVKAIGDYEVLGSTIDDAAGECLDKIGRMLGLGYPAGPVIEQFAKLGNPKAYEFPLPMTTSKDFNLSFSGLKTFARNLIAKITEKQSSVPPTAHIPLTQQQTYDLCASVQYSVFRHIMYKLEKILEKYPVKEVWLGGGVAANLTLRSMIRTTLKKQDARNKKQTNIEYPISNIKFRVPYTKRLTVDNAAMIGITASFKLEKKEFVADLESLERVPKLRIS